MPSLIHQFPLFNGLIVVNSTLINWETPEDHGILRLGYLELIHANVSGAGVLPPALATGRVVFTDLEIFGSNVKELPAKIDTLWPELVVLYIEFTAVETVPLAVFRLEHLQFISLVGNGIRRLPHDALTPFHEPQLRYLILSGNPLESLPPHINEESLFVLQQLSIENTLIVELPQWTERWYEQCSTGKSDCVVAFGSLWCETDANTSLSASTRTQICSEDRGSSQGFIPVDRDASQPALT